MALKNLLGTQFGKLVVIERAPNKKDGTAVWRCLCECGQERIIPGTSLRASRNKSCGCASPVFTAERMTTHGLSRSRTYRIWAGMKMRCSASASGKSRRLYYEKGITVCQEWQTFDGFLKDMGEAPPGLSIDRIDGSKNYEPSNCRWATSKEQGNNTFANCRIKHNHQEQTLSEWAKYIGVKPNTLLYRLRRGWSIERALSKRLP